MLGERIASDCSRPLETFPGLTPFPPPIDEGLTDRFGVQATGVCGAVVDLDPIRATGEHAHH
jgi:hypothetical protein